MPGLDQLEKYADRLNNSVESSNRLLVVLAESDREEQWLPLNVPNEVNGIKTKTISWKQFQTLIIRAVKDGSHAEKRLLNDLKHYLGKVTTMQNQNSNSVFVVSVSYDTFTDSDITFVDVIEKFESYFHPVGGSGTKGGWPIDPPNYMAFRYDGKLQSIHHVESYTVIEDYNGAFPIGKAAPCGVPHFLYKLGLPINPQKKFELMIKKSNFLKLLCLRVGGVI